MSTAERKWGRRVLLGVLAAPLLTACGIRQDEKTSLDKVEPYPQSPVPSAGDRVPPSPLPQIEPTSFAAPTSTTIPIVEKTITPQVIYSATPAARIEFTPTTEPKPTESPRPTIILAKKTELTPVPPVNTPEYKKRGIFNIFYETEVTKRLATFSGLALNQNFLYISEKSGKIVCFDLDQGKLAWNSNTKAHVYDADEKQIYAMQDNTLIYLDTQNGKELWSKSLGSEKDFHPVYVDLGRDFLTARFVKNTDARFSPIDHFFILGKDGKVIDKVKASSNYLWIIGNTYVVNNENGTGAKGINGLTGKQIWDDPFQTRSANGYSWLWDKEIEFGACYPADSKVKPFLGAYNRETGKILWQTPIPDKYSSLTVSGSSPTRLFTHGSLRADYRKADFLVFDTRTGELIPRWTFTIDDGIVFNEESDNFTIVAALNKKISYLFTKAGRLVHTIPDIGIDKIHGQYRHILVCEDYQYLRTGNSPKIPPVVYGINTISGRVEWKIDIPDEKMGRTMVSNKLMVYGSGGIKLFNPLYGTIENTDNTISPIGSFLHEDYIFLFTSDYKDFLSLTIAKLA